MERDEHKISTTIDTLFLIRTYLEKQGLQFLANTVTTAINNHISMRDWARDEHAKNIDRIHP